MKKLISLLILSSAFAHGSVIPVNNPKMLVKDELFSYQWGLLNQGQTLIREKDDIHNLPMKGVENKDIGWSGLVGKFAERRPIVAVLDSGVDLNHPELQGNLWKNEEECGKDPSVDNDNNRLAGDCHGWNFTEAINSEAAKDPSDRDGHGTHIAGIIAALNNGTGMVGVTPNALIMPIKVMRDSNSTSDIPSAEAFARGITYAVDNGADVINMSLGWPRSLETKNLRDAVYYALSRGVVIVAAAGNNNSSEPLYPCAYDGVICVGATTINGNFASFSNFGGHVDTVAPGEGILGLHPMLYEPDFFAVPGFEIRSGTSQSAPFVAGMIAALKAHNKDIKIDEIFARLYQAQPMEDNSKYILGGIANWSALNAEVTVPVVRPVFKSVRQITFRGDSDTTRIAIPIRNFGVLASDISVKVESLSKGITFSSQEITIPALRQGEFKEIPFDVTLVDMTAESDIAFKVSITINGETKSYTNEIPVVRDFRQDPDLKKFDFAFKGPVLPIGTVRDGQLLPLISTVEAYRKSDKHEFFMRRVLKEENKMELTLFTKKEGKYVQHENFLLIDNALTLVNFIRVDLNFDGKEDYFVQAIAEKDGKKYFQYSFYDENLKTLWSDLQNVKLNVDIFVENFNEVAFMKYTHPKLGNILVPSYFTVGMLPSVDQPITSWERLDQTRKKRLYYLEPHNGELRIRALTTNVWEEAVKKELNSKWFDTVETEQVLPPSHEDTLLGKLRVIISVGLGTKRQIFIHTFDTLKSTHGNKLPQLVLQTDYIDPILSITEKGLLNDGEVYFNIYDRTRSKLVGTRGESQVSEYIFRHETDSDVIAGHIATFEQDKERFSVFQTREELISVTTGKEEKRSSRPKLRYSFLSQRLLSEMYFPVTYNRNNEQKAALYVDATSVTGNRIYLFENQNGELVSSIRNSLAIPANCKTLNPVYNSTSETHEFVFLCLEENAFVIRSYEMN